MPKVKQPLLILQGDIDRQVPVHHADRLAELARARKKVPAEAVQVVKLDGVNHLLVAGKTGDLDEYPSLSGRALDPRVAPASSTGWHGAATEALRDLATEAQRARRVSGLPQRHRVHGDVSTPTRWAWQMRVDLSASVRS